MKNIKPFYAVKSNPNINLINLISENKKIGFDVASINEINDTKKYLVSNDIIYSNPCKTYEEIMYAKNKGITKLVVDDINELIKINDIYPTAEILIRIQSNEQFSQITFNSKFGADNKSVANMINYIVEKKLNFVGFSYHVGSRCNNMLAHNQTISHIKNYFIPILLYNKLNIKIINIGGGFTDYNDLISFDKLNGYLVEDIINKYGVKFIAEPGRYFSQNYLSLITTVKSVRFMNNIHIGTINDSIYHTFNGIINDKQSYNPIILNQIDAKDSNRKIVDVKIVGQSCDSGDVINPHLKMPQIHSDDRLLYQNIGAYSLTNRFNGFEDAVIYE